MREGAFLGTPCVNIGTRQKGRERAKNVIDVEYDTSEIIKAIEFQLKHGKYESSHLVGDGTAGKQIAEKVQQKWNEEFNIPINVVLGNEWNAGNLTYHLDSRPVWEGIVNEKKLNKLNKYICIDEICVGNK